MQPFYSLHHQKVLEYGVTSTASSSNNTTTRYIEPKADLSQFSQEDIEWRNSLQKGHIIDCVKTDLSFGVHCWSRGEITNLIGIGDHNNLGDENGNNVKKFIVKYLNESAYTTKNFRADSIDIAKFDTKTLGEEWRVNLKVGDEVDFLNWAQAWVTGTVIKKDEPVNQPPHITIGFRKYTPDGDEEDAMGKFVGKKSMYDQRSELYSVRVQKGHSIVDNADPEGKIVWKNKPIA